MTTTTEAALAAVREELAAAVEETRQQARQEIDQLRLDMLGHLEEVWKAINSLSEAQAHIAKAIAAQASMAIAPPAPREPSTKPNTDTGGMYQ